MIVADAMNPSVLTLFEDDSVLNGLKVLVKRSLSGAPVVSRDQEIRGMITEFDLLLALDYVGEDIPISKVMTTSVIAVESKMPLNEATDIMISNNFRRLPVVDDNKVVGVLSRRDILRIRFNL